MARISAYRRGESATTAICAPSFSPARRSTAITTMPNPPRPNTAASAHPLGSGPGCGDSALSRRESRRARQPRAPPSHGLLLTRKLKTTAVVRKNATQVDFPWRATQAKAPVLAAAIVECTETRSSLRANQPRILDTVFQSMPRFLPPGRFITRRAGNARSLTAWRCS